MRARRAVRGPPGPARRRRACPTSWNSPLVKPGPTWHIQQLPRPTKIFRPRCAAAGYRAAAPASPRASASRKSSKAVRGERSVSIQAASAFAASTSSRSSSSAAGPSRSPKAARWAAARPRVAAQAPGDERCARSHLGGREHRPDRRRPEAVRAAVPAEPALVPHVEQALRVAVVRCDPCARGRPSVKARAGSWQLAQATLPSPESAASKNRRAPELDRLRGAGDAVRGVAHRRGRPGPVREHALHFVGSETAPRPPGERRRAGTSASAQASAITASGRTRITAASDSRRRAAAPSAQVPPHASAHRRTRDEALAPPVGRTSNVSAQRPGMWNSSPSARQRPSGSRLSCGA